MTVFGVHVGLQHTTADELQRRVAPDRGSRLRLDQRVGPLLRRHRQARRRRLPGGRRDARRARLHHQQGARAVRWCTASATATRRCWRRPSPPSTSSVAAAPTWASAPAGRRSSTTPTAFPFPEAKTRLDQLEEGIQCLRGLLHDDVTTFEGQHFNLTEARNEPRPMQAKLPIWIGGGGEKRTLKIAAKYADGWNVPFIAPDAFAHKNADPRRALRGRRPRPEGDQAGHQRRPRVHRGEPAAAVRRHQRLRSPRRAHRQPRRDHGPHRPVRRGRRRPGEHRTARAVQPRGRRAVQQRLEPGVATMSRHERVTFSLLGRVNLIGDHTDYTGGLVLPMAIDRYTEIRGTRAGDRVHLTSVDEDEPVDLPLTIERPQDTEPAWGKYVAGVVAEMPQPHGFHGHVTTDIPIGAGLSSSAALEVAVALALGFAGTPLALAQLCQRAENRASGVPSGIMDQLAIAAGVAGHALLIDCGELTVAARRHPSRRRDRGAVHRAPHAGRQPLRRPRRRVRGGRATDRPAAPHDHRESQVDRRPGDSGASDARHQREPPSHRLRRRDRRWRPARGRTTDGAEPHKPARAVQDLDTRTMDAAVAEVCATPGVFGARMTGGGFGGCLVALTEPGALMTGWVVPRRRRGMSLQRENLNERRTLGGWTALR